MSTDLRYPIGTFEYDPTVTPATRAACIAAIEELPDRMRAAVADLSARQLDTPYRPGGFTVRQTVHHVADSHMNGYVRVKLALTEVRPVIKAYDQDLWAQLEDSTLDVGVSLTLLDALHARWTALWRSLDHAALARVFVHPALGDVTLDRQLQLYAWHSRHHTAHVIGLRERNGWR
jgi:hypothetical protein